jgi:cold shock CspA family protein/ribosome-associated translation inhibitor RaiA
MAIVEISFRRVEKTEAVEKLIREKARKLDEISERLISCRVAVERPQQHQRAGNPYRVRIELGVPGKELLTIRESGQGDMHDPLPKVIRDAFNAARRQLREFETKKSGRVKLHPAQQLMAMVVRLFPEEGYGFLKTPDGREIYFHRNAVLHDDFDRLAIGTGVRFVEEMGEKGPQATTVQIVDKPGEIVSKTEKQGMKPPLGWGR